MGNSYPRYLTFKEGELESTLAHLGATPETATALKGQAPGRSVLVKSHTCIVSFPDGTEGKCTYTRCGPSWHLFRFEHTGRDGKMTPLPVQYVTERIENNVKAIEENAHKRAESAFTVAILREQKDWFCRAVSPTRSTPIHPQMKAIKAKELAGRYALCQRVGNTLIPVSNSFETMAEAVTAWREHTKHELVIGLVIGCCCRFRRRWEEPRLNPLHADSRYPLPFTVPIPNSTILHGRNEVSPEHVMAAEPLLEEEGEDNREEDEA